MRNSHRAKGREEMAMLAVLQVFFTAWQGMFFRPFNEQVKRPGVQEELSTAQR